MADENQQERRSRREEPTSIDMNLSNGVDPEQASDDASGVSNGPLSDALPASAARGGPEGQMPEAGEEEAPQQAAEGPAAEGEDVEPAPLALASLPLRALVTLLGVAVMLFLLVLLTCVRLWGAPDAAPADANVVAALQAAGENGAQESLTPDQLAGLSYSEVMELAAHCETGADYARAVTLYAVASEREEEGLPRVLLARHKLSRALVRAGRYGEAMHVVESLRAVSRPGDELWKNALLTAIAVEQGRGRWEDFSRSLHLLRANSHRYGDEEALNRWLAYSQAMAGVQRFMERSEDNRSVYGVEPPPFGRAPYEGRPLAAEDIVPVSGKYGDGTLRADYRMGEMSLLAEGAPLGDVLGAVATAAGLRVESHAPEHYAVIASLEGVSPEQCVELVLGSVGLGLETQGGRLMTRRAPVRPRSAQDALKAALWGLQEFLILCPDSPQLPEAYYALGHLYMTQGQKRLALDQLGVLSREFPASPWAIYAHYVEGRASCEQQDWSRGERELLNVVDGGANALLTRSAFLWAAQCQMHLGKYVQAVSCFRRALADEVDDPLSPSILYNIAFCMEKSGASRLEVEERYLELRTRYPTSEYAREADYRLARMVLDAGDFWKAASRYEVYLEAWPAADERGRDACVDLMLCYVRSGDYVRAILLGEVMCAAFGAQPQYRAALPLLVEAYEKSRMLRMGLRALDSSLAVTQDPATRCLLMTEKARFMVDLNMCAEARELLASLADVAQDPDQKARASLVEAALLMAEGDSQQAAELCRQVALRCPSEPVRERALRMLGAHYRTAKQFDKAVLAYGGKCPLPAEGGPQ